MMFCGKCGKEIANHEKFCPHCGAENLNAVRASAAPLLKPVPSALSIGAGSGLPRLILMALGALHVLLFFTMSYGSVQTLSALRSLLGTNHSDKLTAANAIRVFQSCADWGVQGADSALIEITILALLPVICGAAVLALSLTKRVKRGDVIVVALSVITLAAYVLFKADLEANASLGLKVSGGGLAYVVSVIQIGLAALCIVFHKSTVK